MSKSKSRALMGKRFEAHKQKIYRDSIKELRGKKLTSPMDIVTLRNAERFVK